MSDTRAARADAMRLRLLQLHDDQIRRCWYCGEWAHHHDNCGACTAPANREDLAQGDTA